jgi:hypothetical protein
VEEAFIVKSPKREGDFFERANCPLHLSHTGDFTAVTAAAKNSREPAKTPRKRQELPLKMA